MLQAILGLLALDGHRDRDLHALRRLLRDPALRLPSKRAGPSPERDLHAFMVDGCGHPVAIHLSTGPEPALNWEPQALKIELDI